MPVIVIIDDVIEKTDQDRLAGCLQYKKLTLSFVVRLRQTGEGGDWSGGCMTRDAVNISSFALFSLTVIVCGCPDRCNISADFGIVYLLVDT
jgi:hypothetical protein